MIGKTISCCFCSSYLFDENETAIVFKNIYVRDLSFPQFWIDRDNKIRCCQCDAIIGKRLLSNPNFMIIWRISVEKEEDDDSKEDEEINEIETARGVLFLERFAQVC